MKNARCVRNPARSVSSDVLECRTHALLLKAKEFQTICCMTLTASRFSLSGRAVPIRWRASKTDHAGERSAKRSAASPGPGRGVQMAESELRKALLNIGDGGGERARHPRVCDFFGFRCVSSRAGHAASRDTTTPGENRAATSAQRTFNECGGFLLRSGGCRSRGINAERFSTGGSAIEHVKPWKGSHFHRY